MSKEKQIEEMAEFIFNDTNCSEERAIRSAEVLYNAGYRKQSEPFSCSHEKGCEWISVEDRLPKEGVRVLVWLKGDGSNYTSIDTDRLSLKRWVRWGRLVTHWMPLPEPPKMKGGAE